MDSCLSVQGEGSAFDRRLYGGRGTDEASQQEGLCQSLARVREGSWFVNCVLLAFRDRIRGGITSGWRRAQRGSLCRIHTVEILT